MQNLTQKQDYLSKQILDQGYDPEQFQDYMFAHSNKQMDLNLWTLSQLKTIVAKYKHKNQVVPQQLHQIQLNKNNKMEEQQNNGLTEQKNQQIQITKNQPLLPKSTQQNINSKSNSVNSSLYRHYNITKKLQLPQLYILTHIQKKNFKVSIRTYTKTVPNNIFKSTYIQYIISTTQNWHTKRRFTDFVWLHEYLKDKYEGLPIPPIPQKTTLRSFDQKHVDYRMMVFERFLNTCIQIPEICSDSVLEIFLRGSEEYFAQNKRKLQQKIVRNQDSCDRQFIFGPDLVLPDQYIIQPHVTNFFKQYSTKLTTISSHLNMLIQNMKKVENDLTFISSQFQQLNKLIQPTVNSASLTTVLHQFCTNFSMHMQKTSNFIKNSVFTQWNYQAMYITNLYTSLKQIQKQQIYFTQKYKNSFLKVSEQGSTAYNNSMQPNKLIKQFQIVKQLYKIKLSQNIRQMNRYQKNQMKLLAKQWSEDIKEYIKDVIGEWMIICTDGMMKSMGIFEGRKLIEVQYIKK